MTNRKLNSGYIALIATLIISFVLTSSILSVSLLGYQSRSNLLDRELKIKSFYFALGCLDQAILRTVQSPGWQPPSSEFLSDDSVNCYVKRLGRDGQEVTFYIQSVARKSVTNLKAVFDEVNFRIISLEELSDFSDL